jgi:hypothetical protein
MLSLLLNWRAVGAFLATLALALLIGQIYKAGQAQGRAELNAYKLAQTQAALAAQEAARAREKTMQLNNQKVTANYESLKTATATAVVALDRDRLQLMSDLAFARAAPVDSGSGLRSAPTTESIILAGCLQRYEEVAGDAQALSNQVRGLQGYVSRVLSP